MRFDTPIEANPVRAALADKVDGIFFTARTGKQKFMAALGILIHVWVDDSPHFILLDAAS